MARIKGITILLYSRKLVGKDPFGKPIYEPVEKEVKNVIVSPMTSTDMVDKLNLEGRKGVYILGIPRGDTNEWENAEVFFFGKKWKVFGTPLEGMDHLMPLDWNKKVTVERYE